ncbi:hypothetical protein PMIN05_000164 [Paraphaeosphaeria minitans]
MCDVLGRISRHTQVQFIFLSQYLGGAGKASTPVISYGSTIRKISVQAKASYRSLPRSLGGCGPDCVVLRIRHHLSAGIGVVEMERKLRTPKHLTARRAHRPSLGTVFAPLPPRLSQ